MFRPCASNGVKGNAPVQGRKTATLPDRECQQIGVGYVPGA